MTRSSTPSSASSSALHPVVQGALRLALFLTSTSALGIGLMACPQSGDGCTSSQDCAIGETCSADGSCVASTTPNPTPSPAPSPGTPQPTPTPSPGAPPDEVELDDHATFFQLDPEDNTKALLPLVWTDEDRLLSLELATGTLSEVDVYDFTLSADRNCNAAFVDFVTDVRTNERWLSCQGTGALEDAHLRVVYEGREDEEAFVPGITMNAATKLPTMVNTDDHPRIIAFARGGETLNIIELDPDLMDYTSRRTDTVDVTFDSIQQVVVPPLPDNANGETILVFDRGAGTVVPLYHEALSTTWVAHPELNVLNVGTDTAWLFFDIDNIDVEDSGMGDPNVLALKPVTETMQAYRIENGLADEDPLEMVSTVGNVTTTYDPEERALVSVAPSGDYAFWVNKGHHEVFRIALDFTNLQDATSEETNNDETLLAIIAASDTELWTSLVSEPLLVKHTFP